jgi:hypothetical protein
VRLDFDAGLASAPRALSDANGIALIDAETLPAVISARSGAMYGSITTYEKEPRPYKIAVSADLDIAFQVVDGAGKAVAGVPVGVRRASGRIVDDLGAPIAKALLGLDTIASEGGTEAWRYDSRLSGECSAEGTFEVRGTPVNPARIRLRATHSGYVQLEAPKS